MLIAGWLGLHHAPPAFWKAWMKTKRNKTNKQTNKQKWRSAGARLLQPTLVQHAQCNPRLASFPGSSHFLVERAGDEANPCPLSMWTQSCQLASMTAELFISISIVKQAHQCYSLFIPSAFCHVYCLCELKTASWHPWLQSYLFLFL